jgi:hypothetical protein
VKNIDFFSDLKEDLPVLKQVIFILIRVYRIENRKKKFKFKFDLYEPHDTIEGPVARVVAIESVRGQQQAVARVVPTSQRVIIS